MQKRWLMSLVVMFLFAITWLFLRFVVFTNESFCMTYIDKEYCANNIINIIYIWWALIGLVGAIVNYTFKERIDEKQIKSRRINVAMILSGLVVVGVVGTFQFIDHSLNQVLIENDVHPDIALLNLFASGVALVCGILVGVVLGAIYYMIDSVGYYLGTKEK